MMNCCSNVIAQREKNHIRQTLICLRQQISLSRRALAKEALCSKLFPALGKFTSILSFCSLPHEIDTSELNTLLAAQGRLLLPKVEGSQLHIFRITDMDAQLAISSWNCLEPIPDQCVSCSLDAIDCVLVPAVAFDRTKYRVGYGKGYYDRLISLAKTKNQPPHFLGIGFEEQLSIEDLPRLPHDQPVDEVLLY